MDADRMRFIITYLLHVYLSAIWALVYGAAFLLFLYY